MSKTSSISVILPSYNSENTIEVCLQSIVNQNCNLELIFINDGSSDKSLDLFRSFKFSSKCSVKVISRENKGFLISLNEGIQLASGDYIARIDADDIWFENHLNLIMAEFDKDKSLVLVGSQAIKINDKSEIVGSYKVPCSQRDIVKHLHKDSAFIHSSVVFNKKAYQNTRGYIIGKDITSMHIADYHLWFELSKLGNIMNLSKETIYYRVSSQSMSRKINKLTNYRARFFVMKKVQNYYKKYFFYTFKQNIKVKLRILQYIFIETLKI